MNRLRTALVVTVVTVLIWVFAEGESLRTASVASRIQIVPPAGMALEIVDPPSFTGATLTLRGSTAGIDSVRSALDDPVVLDRGHGIPDAAGEHVIDLTEVLRDAKPLADSGVSIVEADPATLRIRLVALEQLTLPVRLEIEGELVGAPSVSPTSAIVMAPVDAARTLPQGGSVTARVSADQLRGMPRGVERTIQGVRLHLPGQLEGVWGVKGPDPETVSVTMTLRDTTSSAVLPQLPVQIVLAISEVGRWHISLDDPFIADVTIRGPSDLVERVANPGGQAARSERITALALLRLNFQELEEGITSKDVEFVLLPSDAGVLEFEAADPTVGITIERLEAAADP